MKKILFLSFFIILFSNSLTHANELKIILKVNDNIITNYDIEKEVNYLKSLNKSMEKFNQKKIIETAQNSLIREKIKKDEIDKFYNVDYKKVIISKDLEIVVENFSEGLGFNDKIEFENYLLSKKIDILDLKKKFIIEQTWNKLIVDKFLNSLNIDQKGIEKKVDDFIKNNSEQLSFNLSEIIFFEKSKIKNEEKFREILKSIDEVGFKETAILHSIADSSKFGGEIGWVDQNQISNEIFEFTKNLKEGEFTNPINTAAGIIILRLNKRKTVPTNIDREEEINKLITFEKNRKLNEYSVIHYKQLENKSYVKKF
jgi:peptidyl-prolyl cis-trans isomerase SurA